MAAYFCGMPRNQVCCCHGQPPIFYPAPTHSIPTLPQDLELKIVQIAASEHSTLHAAIEMLLREAVKDRSGAKP